MPCAPIDPNNGINPVVSGATRYVHVLDQGADVVDNTKSVVVPKCVRDDFTTFTLSTNPTGSTKVDIKQPTVDYLDKFSNPLLKTVSPLQGCASFYDSSNPANAEQISFNTTKTNPVGRCCKCHWGLQEYRDSSITAQSNVD
jgi:hypothetical protein